MSDSNSFHSEATSHGGSDSSYVTDDVMSDSSDSDTSASDGNNPNDTYDNPNDTSTSTNGRDGESMSQVVAQMFGDVVSPDSTFEVDKIVDGMGELVMDEVPKPIADADLLPLAPGTRANQKKSFDALSRKDQKKYKGRGGKPPRPTLVFYGDPADKKLAAKFPHASDLVDTLHISYSAAPGSRGGTIKHGIFTVVPFKGTEDQFDAVVVTHPGLLEEGLKEAAAFDSWGRPKQKYLAYPLAENGMGKKVGSKVAKKYFTWDDLIASVDKGGVGQYSTEERNNLSRAHFDENPEGFAWRRAWWLVACDQTTYDECVPDEEEYARVVERNPHLRENSGHQQPHDWESMFENLVAVKEKQGHLDKVPTGRGIKDEEEAGEMRQLYNWWYRQTWRDKSTRGAKGDALRRLIDLGCTLGKHAPDDVRAEAVEALRANGNEESD